MKIDTYITFNDLFPNIIAKDIDSYFKLLNRNEVLFETINILNRLSVSNNNIALQQEIVINMCTESVHKKVIELLHIKNDSVFIFSGQLLEAIKYIIKSVPDQGLDIHKSLSIRENSEILLSLYLLFSDVWNNKIFTHKSQDDYFNNAITIRQSIKYNMYVPNMYFFISKINAIYNYIFPTVFKKETKNDFKVLFKELMGIYPYDYVNAITFLLLFINTNKEYSSGFFESNFFDYLSENCPAIKTFIDKSSISITDLETTDNFEKQILKTPFLHIDNGYCVISYIDFLQFALDSPVFTLNSERYNVLSIYGKVLEQYTQSIFERIYPCSTVLINRLKLNISYKSSEIDCCIENANSYIMVEIKNSYINSESCDSNNPDQFLIELNKKYGLTPGNKKKGIAQLAQHVVSYSKNEIPELNPGMSIIPLLITNDPLVPIAVSNSYLQNAFSNLVGKQPNLIVYPLIIISIKELELMEESIKKYGFESIIKSFYDSNTTGNLTFFDLFTENESLSFYDNQFSITETLEAIKRMGFSYAPEIMKRLVKEKDF